MGTTTVGQLISKLAEFPLSTQVLAGVEYDNDTALHQDVVVEVQPVSEQEDGYYDFAPEDDGYPIAVVVYGQPCGSD